MVAAQIIDQVKRNVPECGGQFSEVVIIPKQQIRRLTPMTLLEVEYRTRDVGRLLKPVLMSLSDPNLTDAEFQAELDHFVGACRKLRQQQKSKRIQPEEK